MSFGNTVQTELSGADEKEKIRNGRNLPDFFRTYRVKALNQMRQRHLTIGKIPNFV